jgi:hypothetical protein
LDLPEKHREPVRFVAKVAGAVSCYKVYIYRLNPSTRFTNEKARGPTSTRAQQRSNEGIEFRQAAAFSEAAD